MANQWLRLWHDMPNDPKFRTIARASNQPIALVISIYIHLLVTASQNVTRGHADVTNEDLASALDVTESQVGAVLDAMQGRLLEGNRITGWEKRQPLREDAGNEKTGAKSAAQRKRAQREREKVEAAKGDQSQPVTNCHAGSQKVTTDKDKDKDTEITTTTDVVVVGAPVTPATRKPIPGDWKPCTETIRTLHALHGVPMNFIDQQTAEFKIFWRDRQGEASSWNATFLKRCAAEWKKHLANPQPEKPHGFIERVTNTDWAEGLT